ncbi:MAG: hypothetical protein GY788_20955 [bacterium]|nr:hypothetical protein [bacterium]
MARSKHANKGLAWEQMLSDANYRYQAKGDACVWKTHPEAFLRQGRLAYKAKGPPDYMGALAGGRAVVFEAKRCAAGTKRWPLSKLLEHQAGALDRYAALGAITFVALRWGRVGWLLPWAHGPRLLAPDLPELWQRWSARAHERHPERMPKGWASLTREQVEQMGVEITGGAWLDAVHRSGAWGER